MKIDLKAKFLMHLNQKKQNEGFTLIELLVVIIIIGILAAIALPSFLNQANKAKESEAKEYVGSENRAQQAYYLEKSNFVVDTTNIGSLGLGIATQTSNYNYNLTAGGAAVNGAYTAAAQIANPLKGALATVRAYVGGVQVGTVTSTSEATTLAVLCQGQKAPAANSGKPTGDVNAIKFSTSAPSCDLTEYNDLGK